VSLLSAAPAMDKLKGLTFFTLSEEDKAENRASYNMWDVVSTVFVLAIVIFVMAFFNGK